MARSEIEICLLTHKNFMERSWISRDKRILQSIGFRAEILDIESELPSINILFNLKKYLKKLRECHIVVSWFSFPSSIFMSKILGIPTIANAVGYEVASYPEMSYGLPQNYLARFLLTLALKSSDAVIAISRESLRWAYRWSKKPGFVIYEGIDVEKCDCKAVGGRVMTKDPTVITIAFLGLMNIIRKDILTLIKSIKIVKNRYPNIKLYIVGRKMDGYPLLKKLTQELNLNDNIVFTGEISNEELLKLLCRADLFIMTSYQEGFPTVACEAAAAGVPLIVSNRPAMNEVFTNENALLVNPGNPIELANTIIKSLENKTELAKLAEKAITTVKENFSLDARKKKMQLFITYFLKKCLLEIRQNNKYNLYSIKMNYLTIFVLFSFMIPILYLVMKIFESIAKFIKLKINVEGSIYECARADQ